MNPCNGGCTAYQFCYDHLTQDYRCEHGHVLPPQMVEANRVVQRLLDAHATVIDEQDSPDSDQEAFFERERESVVRKLAEGQRYPRIEVPTEEGWYWRAHRLWEVIRFADGPLLFMQAGVSRAVHTASGPWFGPVPPPEGWK